ncbi:MBG domain-containing protein, partial [Mongoliitalea lutea]
ISTEFQILPKSIEDLTLDAISAQTFNGSPITPSITVRDGQKVLNNETEFTVVFFNNTNAGNATVLISGTGNYEGTIGDSFEILKAPLIISALNTQSIYGERIPELKIIYDGFVANETTIEQEPSIFTEARINSPVGIYPIILKGGEASNYSITLINGELTIAERNLSIIANKKTKVFETDDPQLTFSVENLIGGDVITGELTRESGEDIGTYLINLGTVSAGPNYLISFTPADFEIIPAEIVEILPIETIEIPWGSSLQLPSQVTIVASNESLYFVEIDWNTSTINRFSSGRYLVNGFLNLPEWLASSEPRAVTVTIVVLPKPLPQDIQLSNDTFTQKEIGAPIEVGEFKVVDSSDNIHLITFLGDGYDNGLFQIIENTLLWNNNTAIPGREVFTIVVQVQDRDGNIVSKLLDINRLRANFDDIIINNTFTPNGDGVNDTWGIPDLSSYSGVRIQVYERSGLLLFSTTNPEVRWDGTFNNKDLPVGTYYWVVDIIETGQTRRGILNLFRR